jgi:hypothetical protein
MHVGWSAGGQSEVWCHGNKRSSKNLEKWSSLHLYFLWIWSTFLISGRLSTWWISTKIHGSIPAWRWSKFDWIPSLQWNFSCGQSTQEQEIDHSVVSLAFLQPWTLTVPLFADHKKSFKKKKKNNNNKINRTDKQGTYMCSCSWSFVWFCMRQS